MKAAAKMWQERQFMDEISAVTAVGSGKQLSSAQRVQAEKLAARDNDVQADEAAQSADNAGVNGVSAGKQLNPEQKAEVEKLAARDRDVRTHEAAHMAAAGALATGIEYAYELGPDGKLYAVGGQVKISIPPGLSPEQRLAAARELRLAAQAPTDPSGQDMAVAARASQIEANALEEIAKKHTPAAQSTSRSSTYTPFRGLDRTA